HAGAARNDPAGLSHGRRRRGAARGRPRAGAAEETWTPHAAASGPAVSGGGAGGRSTGGAMIARSLVMVLVVAAAPSLAAQGHGSYRVGVVSESSDTITWLRPDGAG